MLDDLLNGLSQRARRILRSFAVASAFIGAACAAWTLRPADYDAHRTSKVAYATTLPAPVEYTVKPGDYLWHISERMLGANTDKQIVTAINRVVTENRERLPLLEIDNRSAAGDTADGIPGDYLEPGNRLQLGVAPGKLVERQYSSFTYTQPPNSSALFAGAAVAATLAGAAAGAAARHRSGPNPEPTNPFERAIDLYYGRYDLGAKPAVAVAAVCAAAGISKSTLYRRLRKRGLSSRTTYYRLSKQLG